ncbi:hypothetical protein [Bacillus sp. T33-2]|uniref:hypothetical protein n=1 Tax=Bacillus sp. T33-2 TaxID=2054168 RepID=UPI000C77F691|nr:hypothetical protein [Bacillus sp. T33-2]PLR98212.1 hypothetical protein CVD19_06350 [Bacillus sp. T33-2]
MGEIPAFHPEWLVTFWLTTPGLNLLNPHYLLIFIAIFTLGMYFFRKQRVAVQVPDEDEKRFKHLLMKKTVIEKQVDELEESRKQGSLTEEKYEQKAKELEKHLDQVKKELLHYTL